MRFLLFLCSLSLVGFDSKHVEKIIHKLTVHCE